MRTILPSGKQPWSRWHHRLHQLLLDDPSLLPQGSGLLIAISGGQDSLALTRLLLDLREQRTTGSCSSGMATTTGAKTPQPMPSICSNWRPNGVCP